LEGVKTDPYLYLRDGESTEGDPILTTEGGVTTVSNSIEEYDINYVVAVRNWSNDVTYDEEFIGYEYGGDALVLNLNGGYKKLGKYSVEGNAFYMAHGTFDKWTEWEKGSDASTPTSSNSNYNKKTTTSSKDAVEHTVVLGINGNYIINSNTNTYGQLDYVYKRNYGNISGETYNDVQLTAGIKYRF
jgi:hypothetical protein